MPVDHPATRGHFPGNPIIPGVVLLSAALQAIEAATTMPLSLCRIKSVKFFRPMRPGDTIALEYSQTEADEIRFGGSVDGKIVLVGHIQCNFEPQGA
jgi:3-hydroxyacyl-[acyl-carrier-protein] dehydratase